MTTYITTEGHVYHIEADIMQPDMLVFSDGHSLKVTDGATILPLVGSAQQSGYVEGIGSAARFNRITGFSQISSTTIVTADNYNHCLRIVERTSLSTSVLAGLCQTSGNSDGQDARFSYPWSVIRDPKSSTQILVSDRRNSVVKQVELVVGFTRTLIRNGLENPTGMALDSERGRLLIANYHYISEYEMESQTLSTLTGTPTPGYAEGRLGLAKYNFPREMAFLSSDVTLVADRFNHRVRVVNTTSNSVSSICAGDQTTRDGPANQFCGLDLPFSLLVNTNTIYTGQDGAIRRMTCE